MPQPRSAQPPPDGVSQQAMTTELFEEENADAVTPRSKTKHWYVFHIVAQVPD